MTVRSLRSNPASAPTSPHLRIRQGKEDQSILTLVQARDICESVNQPETYENVVVRKPWGYEFEVYDDGYHAIWFLNINKRQGTSMHCHPNKDTRFIALSGNVWCQTLLGNHMIMCGETLVVEKGVFHSVGTFSDPGACLLEVETPPNKTDLVRFTDQYGRVGSGYEGRTEMETEDLNKFGYFRFDGNDTHWLMPLVRVNR